MSIFTKLTLSDFRSYKKKSFNFTEDQVVFWGANGRGKTNIIEALSILSLGKSWRETASTDLIRENILSAKVEATFSDNEYQVIIEPKSRSFLKNEKKISLKSHLGNINTLLFCPEHLGLFSGGKMDRLNFFDRFLIQIFPHYRDLLLRASKAHKQKVRCLRHFSEDSNLNSLIKPWNIILSETLPEIIQTRQKFCKDINPILQVQLEKISGNKNPIQIEFSPSEEFEITTNGILNFFQKEAGREVAARKNFIAPHSGDFWFYLRAKKITQTASRGEIRSVLLALLAAKKEYLQSKTNNMPILLLDDVFSELDDNRQKHLEQLCQGTQSFFTTTHQEHFQNFSGKVQPIVI